MLKRQIHLTKLRQEKENSMFVLTHRYKSKLGMDDETAKKSLSTFAYNQLFRKSKKLKHLALNNGTTKVWPCGQLMDCDKVVTIQTGQRCTCYQHTAFDHQCCHEICSEGGFDNQRFGRRRLNEKTFQQMHSTFWLNNHLPACTNKDDDASVDGPEINPEFNIQDKTKVDADLSEKESCATILEREAEDSGTESDAEYDALPLSKLSYQSLIQQFEVLAQLVQSDRYSIACVFKMIQTVTARARNGLSINAHFDTSFGATVSTNDAPRTPMNETMSALSTPYEHNWLKSQFERQRDHEQRFI
jgi:hypothetical protein